MIKQDVWTMRAKIQNVSCLRDALWNIKEITNVPIVSFGSVYKL